MIHRPCTPSWREWLTHPHRSLKIDAAVKEYQRSGEQEVNPSRPPTHYERVIQSGAVTRSHRTVATAGKKLARMAQRYHKHQSAAAEHRQQAHEIDEQVHLSGGRPGRKARHAVAVTAYSGHPTTAAQARKKIQETLETINEQTMQGDPRHLHSKSTVAALLAYLLLFVDVLALFISIGRLFNLNWAAPAIVPVLIAVVFSVVGAGVMAKLATALGKHLWSWRMSDPAQGAVEKSSRSGIAIICAVLLAGLSIASGLSIWIRIQEEADIIDAGALGFVVGLLVGIAGAAAPWVIVWQEFNNGSVETRTIAALAPIVHHADQHKRGHILAAKRDEQAAVRLREDAERLFVRTVHKCGVQDMRADQIILVARSLHLRTGLHPEEVCVPPDWSQPMAALATRLLTDLRPLQIALSQMGSNRGTARYDGPEAPGVKANGVPLPRKPTPGAPNSTA